MRYPKYILMCAVIISVLFVASSCCKHEWVEATCTEPKTCSKCGKTEGAALGHNIDYKSGQIITESTCTEPGVVVYSCLRCNANIEEVIEPLGHSFSIAGTIREATCTNVGIQEFQCNRCGYEEQRGIPKREHIYVDGICSVCGNFEEIDLYMSLSETRTAESIRYLSDRSIQEDEGHYTLLFGLENASEEKVAVPAIIDIRIVNDDGKEVYRSRRELSEYDFGTWSNRISGSRLLASVEIDFDAIKGGTTSDGTIFFTIFNPGYFSFSESELSLYDLPYGLDSDEIITVNPYEFYADMDNEIRFKNLYSDKWLEMQVRVESVYSDYDDSYYIYASDYNYLTYEGYYLNIYPDTEKVSETQLANLRTGQYITIKGFLGDGRIRGAEIIKQ